MDDQMDDAATGVDRQADRIDEERHVVVDDLDDRVRRQPTVRSRVRVVDPNFRPARAAPLGKVPQRQRRTAEVAWASSDDIGRGHMLVEFADHAFGRRPLRRIEYLCRERCGFSDERRLFLFYRAGHPAGVIAAAPGFEARRCCLSRLHAASDVDANTRRCAALPQKHCDNDDPKIS